jgi:hypothetical protein
MMTTQTLSIVLEGAEQVTALRAKITIEKKDIISVSWHDAFNSWPSWQLRMPGSYLPSWLMAGSYWSGSNWDFVYAKNPKGMIRPILQNVIVIMTKNERYRRIIFQTTKDSYKEIDTWYKGT